ncbi:hypothetical protein [Lentibacillus salicampi]|uniref:Uncharacterized protein n=1 Tax=Lentibacillus salicampi TaxID=175306 RepID=A0A4Y9AGS2_9BACI|nr:hypothetical protein [Lentibacillus salicampi]TFJ94170.1 hypothetical protein E4U82_02620 [Lentibacillus salicampi]
MEEESILIGLLIGLGVFLLIFGVIAVIFYVLQAIGLFKIAKQEGYEDKAWMAWVPIVNYFLLTLLVENDVHASMRGKFTLIYGITIAATILLNWFIPPIGILPLIVIVYGFYFLAERYSTNAVAHVVIAAITLSATIPIQVFLFRNREPVN